MKPLRRRILAPDYIYTHRLNHELVPVFEDLYFKRTPHYGKDVLESDDLFEMAKRLGYGFMGELERGLSEARKSGFYPDIPDVSEAGTKGCDWRYAPELLTPESSILSFGVGGDITFECALSDATGALVWCFDPTPPGIACAEETMRAHSGIRFRPWGVGDRDAVVPFYALRGDAPGSLSAENLRGGSLVVQAQMLRLPEICRRLDFTRIDLLKIDIEGSEYGVIADIVNGDLEIDQILVEFDQPFPPWETEKAIDSLFAAGYWLASVWDLNALFLHGRVLKLDD